MQGEVELKGWDSAANRDRDKKRDNPNKVSDVEKTRWVLW